MQLCSEVCPNKWKNSKSVVFGGFHCSLCSIPCAASNDTINTLSLQAVLKPLSLFLIPFPSVVKVFIPFCYQSTHPWEGSSQIQPSLITSIGSCVPKLCGYNSSILLLIAWEISHYTLSPPLGNLLIHCYIALFSISGHDRHHSRFFLNVCWCQWGHSTSAMEVKNSIDRCKARDPAVSNDKHQSYQSKTSLVFIYSFLSCISSRSRVCFNKLISYRQD